MKNPVTEKDIGVTRGYDDRKWAELRARSKQEEKERYKASSKYKKEKNFEAKLYKIGEEVLVLLNRNPAYALLEIIDIYIEDEVISIKTGVCYCGIVKKVTHKEDFSRVGHALSFITDINQSAHAYYWSRSSYATLIPGDFSKMKWYKVGD